MTRVLKFSRTNQTQDYNGVKRESCVIFDTGEANVARHGPFLSGINNGMEKRYRAAIKGRRPVWKQITAAVRARQSWMLERLRQLVELESPSNDKAAVDRAATLVASW